jgi:hypothetical protein
VLRQLEARFPIRGALDDESLGCEPSTQSGNHPLLVVDQQYSHTPSIGCERRIARRRAAEKRADMLFVGE